MIILVLLLAPVFLAGALVPPLQRVGVVAALVLALWALIDAILLPKRRHFEIERVVPRRVSLDEPAAIAFEIRNRSGRRVEISLAEDLPESMEARPPQVAGAFAPGEQRHLEYRLLAKRRGRFQLSGLDVRVRPALGLFYRQVRLELPQDIQIFPNLVNIKRYELQLRRGSAEQGLARLRQVGQGTNFESLRPHTAGDGLSRVDWKSTARRRQLVVRNYEPERQQHVLLAIDLGRASAGEFEGLSRLDYFINAALMLAYVTLRQGDWFSLVAFGQRVERYVPPMRKVQNIDRIANALCDLEPKLIEPDYAAACRFIGLKHRKRSLVCLMTDVVDRDTSAIVIGYMARFARYHLPVAVTLDNTEVRALAEAPLAQSPDPYDKAVALDVLAAREEALQLMRRQGVDILSVPPRQLTPELIGHYLQIKAQRRL